MWEITKFITPKKNNMKNVILSDLNKLEFLNWLSDKNFLVFDQLKIWEEYITQRDKTEDESL